MTTRWCRYPCVNAAVDTDTDPENGNSSMATVSQPMPMAAAIDAVRADSNVGDSAERRRDAARVRMAVTARRARNAAGKEEVPLLTNCCSFESSVPSSAIEAS